TDRDGVRVTSGAIRPVTGRPWRGRPDRPRPPVAHARGAGESGARPPRGDRPGRGSGRAVLRAVYAIDSSRSEGPEGSGLEAREDRGGGEGRWARRRIHRAP